MRYDRYQVYQTRDYRTVWYDNKPVECRTCGLVQTTGKCVVLQYDSDMQTIIDWIGYDCKQIDWLSYRLDTIESYGSNRIAIL